jgi:hypothetical protein
VSERKMVCCLPECWPLERLKRVEKYPPGLFLIVSVEMLALLLSFVVLRIYTLLTLGP